MYAIASLQLEIFQGMKIMIAFVKIYLLSLDFMPMLQQVHCQFFIA